MNDVLTLLQQRNSASKLALPGPSKAEFIDIFQAATRAPDHARLKPWRFLLIEGDDRASLGELFVLAVQQHDAQLTAEHIAKIAAKALRSPVIVIVIARIQDHPKVPETEQILSAGCAAYSIQLAAESLGYSSIWRTGDMSLSSVVNGGLGLNNHEKIIGFLYIGTRVGNAKPLPDTTANDFVKSWPDV